MKKKIFAVSLILVLLLSLTSCVRMDITMKVHSDGTVDISQMVAYSDEITSMMSEGGEASSSGLTEEEIKDYEEKGYTYEEYNEDGYSGYTVSQKGLDLKSSDGMETPFDEDDIFTVDGNHVVFSMTPFTDSEDEETVGYLSTIKSSGGYMNVNLELPVKPTDHNATTVSDDGKTLTWDLTTLGMNDKIYAEFDLPSNDISRVTESITSSPVLKWLLPVLGVVLVGAIVAIVASKNKKRKAAQQAAAVQNAVPYGAVPQQNNVVTEVPAQPVPADAAAEIEAKTEEIIDSAQETVQEAAADASAEIEAKTDEIIDAAQDAVADTPVEEIVSDITDGE